MSPGAAARVLAVAAWLWAAAWVLVGLGVADPPEWLVGVSLWTLLVLVLTERKARRGRWW